MDQKKVLLRELDRLLVRPKIGDKRVGAPVSPRATGNYRAFIDMVAEPTRRYTPHKEPDGGISVKWVTKIGNKKGEAVVIFQPNGGMYLEFNGQGNHFDHVDQERLRQFAYVTA